MLFALEICDFFQHKMPCVIAFSLADYYIQIKSRATEIFLGIKKGARREIKRGKTKGFL